MGGNGVLPVMDISKLYCALSMFGFAVRDGLC